MFVFSSGYKNHLRSLTCCTTNPGQGLDLILLAWQLDGCFARQNAPWKCHPWVNITYSAFRRHWQPVGVEDQNTTTNMRTGPSDSHPPECVIPDGVLIQVGPPDDEHLLLETRRGVEINTLRKSASSSSLTRITSRCCTVNKILSLLVPNLLMVKHGVNLKFQIVLTSERV